jgi:hypothetical protein
MIAVEFMVKGCAAFWTQLERFHPLLDVLSASGNSGEALADELNQVSFRLHIILDALDVSLEDESTRR